MAIISMVTDRDVQGAVQGIASSCGAVASVLGLLGGGLLYEFVGTGVFQLAAAITVVVVLLSVGIRAPVGNKAKPTAAESARS